ncbi:MAG: hypothetical protein P1V81_10080 [Planctomycetota bacterium]|nr:hypothetical protein [Planctomycetota bacterium]
MSFRPSAPVRVLGLLALGLVVASCEGMGEALGQDPGGFDAAGGISTGSAGLSQPVGLNPGDQTTLDKIGATLGQIFRTGDYLSRDMGADEQIEAVKKARSYQESIEKKGKSKEVASVIDKTEAVYAVPVIGSGVERGMTQLVLIDPATGQPVDNNVYTVPAVADNTLIQVGTVKALFTSSTD